MEKSGKCPICTINLYGDEKTVTIEPKTGKKVTIKGRPTVFPCGVGRFRPEKGKDQGKCPFENESDQKRLDNVADDEKIAGLLGTMYGETFGDG